jgi:hypothetical protein
VGEKGVTLLDPFGDEEVHFRIPYERMGARMHVEDRPGQGRGLVLHDLLLFVVAGSVRPGLDVFDSSVDTMEGNQKSRRKELLRRESKMLQGSRVTDASIAAVFHDLRIDPGLLDKHLSMMLRKLGGKERLENRGRIRGRKVFPSSPVLFDFRIEKVGRGIRRFWR